MAEGNPASSTDASGFPSAAPSDLHLSESRVKQMEQSIRDGNFKDVTSVLVARDGNLVYEHYFDADGIEALRNTRSATKTVIGMLVGIAVDRKMLRTDAKVMSFFPDKQPVQNPDRRKSAITVEDFLTMSSLLECDDENQFSHANARKDIDYGYLWWLQEFHAGNRSFRSYGMYRTGGNKVYVLPETRLVVVVATTNFRIQGAGALTDKLLTDYILDSVDLR